MDALDHRILAILLEDAHTPFRDIAASAGTTLGTVHNRIKKMREAGVIRRFVADVDAEALGYAITALIELKIGGGHLVEVQQALTKDRRVVSVFDVTGDMDTLVVGKFRDTKDLDAFVKAMHERPHVRETRTRLALNILKESLSPRP